MIVGTTAAFLWGQLCWAQCYGRQHFWIRIILLTIVYVIALFAIMMWTATSEMRGAPEVARTVDMIRALAFMSGLFKKMVWGN